MRLPRSQADRHAPKQQLWLESQGQIDFYDDTKLIAPAADAVAASLDADRDALPNLEP
jgi:hypothetical protein